MFAKGNLNGGGTALAAYLVTGKDGERAELVELRGFASSDIFEAFQDVEIQAEGTKCEMPFFHCSVRLPDDEKLSREQWQYVADRIEKKLGFEGQGRAIAFHHNDELGHTHMHIAWSRIDTEEMRAIDPGLYKNKLSEVCRGLELELGLRRLDNERDEQNGLAAGRNKSEQARRLGTDVKEIRETIRDCWERSDNGRSFEAALAEHGYILARGDKRDFVVIDDAGGDHALSKRITGASAAETRARLADISKENLPTVAEAKQQIALQAERNAPAKEVEPDSRSDPAPEFAAAARRTAEPAAPIYDRDAANADWEAKLTEAAIAQEAARAAPEARQQPEAGAGQETRAGGHEPSGGPGHGLGAEESIEAWAQRHSAAESPEHAARETLDAAEAAVDAGAKAVSGTFSSLAKGAEKLLAGIFSILDAEPKLTPEQAKNAARADEEQAAARAQTAAEQEKEAKQDWNIFEQDRRQQQEELERKTGYRDDGRERERERDRF